MDSLAPFFFTSEYALYFQKSSITKHAHNKHKDTHKNKNQLSTVDTIARLCNKDRQWLKSCKHPQRRNNFLRSRRMLCELFYPYAPRRLDNGYVYINPYHCVSITYKKDLVIVGRTTAFPAHQGLFFGVDIEKRHVSDRLSKRLLSEIVRPYDMAVLCRHASQASQASQGEPQALYNFLGALAFSGKEAIHKALGRYGMEKYALHYELYFVRSHKTHRYRLYEQEWLCTFKYKNKGHIISSKLPLYLYLKVYPFSQAGSSYILSILYQHHHKHPYGFLGKKK